MDMSGKSGSHSSPMSGVSMAFTNSYTTTLFSQAWTPTTPGGYVATCIFLAILAIISRLLLAWRSQLEVKWHDRAINRRYIIISGQTEADRERQIIGKGGEKSEEALLTVNGLDERVKVVRSAKVGRGVERQPWRLSTDVPRACLFTAYAGVAYLL